MATLVPVSGTPLVFDALPATKVRHYYGEAALEPIYTLARMYFLKDALALSLSAFERDPDEMSLIEFALAGGPGGNIIRLTLGRDGLRALHPKEAMGSIPPPAAFSGADEQGWYWGAQLTLPADMLRGVGLLPGPGVEFRAALFKARADEAGYGSSFLSATPRDSQSPGEFPLFRIVSF